MDSVAPTIESAFSSRAAATPEVPVIFFRGPRGHFTWWSWRRAVEATSRGGEPEEAPGAEAAAEFLRGTMALESADRKMGEALARRLPEPRPRRHVWLTTGDLRRPLGRALAAAAIVDGWAIVHEPGAALATGTFEWSRPTVVGGAGHDLVALLDGLAALAPRWRARAWLARRIARLAAMVVEHGDDEPAVAARLRSVGSPASVLSIPQGGW